MQVSLVTILFVLFSDVYGSSAPSHDQSACHPSISKRIFSLSAPQMTPDYRRFIPETHDDPRIERQFEKGKRRRPGEVDGIFNGLPAVIERSYLGGEMLEFNSKLRRLENIQHLVAWSPGYIVKLPTLGEHDTFVYREAFTDAEAHKIEEQFKKGEKRRKGKFGPKVDAEFQGLPVVIIHFLEGNEGKHFTVTLKRIEEAHQLVRWTKAFYIVKVRGVTADAAPGTDVNEKSPGRAGAHKNCVVM